MSISVSYNSKNLFYNFESNLLARFGKTCSTKRQINKSRPSHETNKAQNKKKSNSTKSNVVSLKNILV